MFENEKKISRFGRPSTKVLLMSAAAVIVVLAAVAGYFIWRTVSLTQSTQTANQEKTAQIVEKVSKLFTLPADEKPTIAQITDKEKIKDQLFFAKAETGDYLLVYSTEKFALIYRERENKIINAGPITNQQTNP